MTPIKNTELVVIVFEIKDKDVEKKRKKLSRIIFRSTASQVTNDQKANSFRSSKKGDNICPFTNHQTDRKLSILSHLFLLKSSKFPNRGNR